MPVCLQCGCPTQRVGYLYCSNKCQTNFRYDRYIAEWKSGKVSGGRGVRAKNISGHVKRYMEAAYGSGCSQCGWHERNSITGKIPLEIDHIDGNSENNSEDNLRLLCPNCHSLTPRFRNLNRGNGRKWRRDKYIKQDATLAQR